MSHPNWMTFFMNINPFDAGVDLAGVLGGYASAVQQAITLAKPSSTYGIVLYNNTAPDVTGVNAWRKRCLWINTSTPSALQVFIYRDTVSPGWINITTLITSGSLSGQTIQNGTITLDKLSATGGAALQLIRLNAGATGFEFVAASNLFGVNSIPTNRLNATGLEPLVMHFLGSQGGLTQFYPAEILFTHAPIAAASLDLIGVPDELFAKSKFATVRTGDPNAIWRTFDPALDIDNNTLSGAKLTDATVPATKIAGGTNDQILARRGGVVGFFDPWFTLKVFQSGLIDFPNANNSIVPVAHGLNTVLFYEWKFVCITTEGGWPVNSSFPVDRVPPSSASEVESTAIQTSLNGPNLRLYVDDFPFVFYGYDGAINADFTPTRANWKLQVVALGL
jgi:hypothetical protein